jgi:Raf kinase inhibitor-like YbhB/YbcL family protein
MSAFLLRNAILLAAACAGSPSPTDPQKGSPAMPFTLTSPEFSEGQPIPSQYTCDGPDLQLPVEWSGAPAGTTEFALVMDDPDARGFVHWVVVDIPVSASGIQGRLPTGAREGRNDFGRIGYGGPCPPSGTHRYDLTLYALSSSLGISGVPTADAVRSAAAGRTIAITRLTGRYTRRR